MKHFLIQHKYVLPLFAALFLAAGGESEARSVITWVPPYSIETCKQRLEQDFGDGVGMKDGLTHLALQFWIPSQSGKDCILTPTYKVTSSDVRWFVTWGERNDVKIMLCVYNADLPYGPGGWDYEGALNAFRDNRSDFISSIMSEIKSYGLDGVEIDLESPSGHNDKKNDFVRFLGDLSAKLRPLNKELTAASYGYIFNAPNTRWWPDMEPCLEAYTAMSYQSAGHVALSSDDWPYQSYQWMKDQASDKEKLMIGFPGTTDHWRGDSLSTHLQWVIDDGQVGVAIWDAALSGEGEWLTKEIWKKLAQVKTSSAGEGCTP